MPAPAPLPRKDYSGKTPMSLKKVQWVRIRRNITSKKDEARDLREYVTRLTGGAVIAGSELPKEVEQ